MKKKIFFYVGFFVVLITAFFLFLFSGTDYYKVKLPVMNYVQDFSFTGQDGSTVNEHDVDGKVYVADYFFTTCKGICPKMNANLATIFEKFRNDSDFAIVSHTSLPETDTVPLLKAYEEKMIGKNPQFAAKWYFVTGTKDSLYKMARQSYLLDNDKNNSINIKDHFIHTQFFALVDKQRRVRGIYDGLKDDELQRLQEDIEKLLQEPDNGNIFNHSNFSNNPG
ncbi:MAG TPA: SCO family protein [Ginsengibacter sp.]|jgi:protein SCO1/2